MPELSETLAENLRLYRKRRKLEQTELAERVGLSSGFISELENAKGNPTLLSLEKIAHGLNVKVVTLLEAR